jgi:putative endonuclease
MKMPAVYIISNKPEGVLYTGVTADLARRIWQHRSGLGSRFAAKYGCCSLVWYEFLADMPTAIAREKQIKGGSRAKKLALVEAMNPAWSDLYEMIARALPQTIALEPAGSEIASPAARNDGGGYVQ